MSSYNPPTEDITEFNTSLFNQPEETLSQAESDKLYLSKTKNDISTASSTTFNGGVNVGGTLNLKSGVKTTDLTQSSDGVFTIGNRNPSGSISILAQTAGGANQGISLSSTALTMNNFIPLNTRIIRSTDTSSTHSVFDDMIASGSLTIGGTASTNSIRGNTTFPQNVTIQGTLDIVSGTNTNKLAITGGNATYTMNAGATTATTHLFNTYTNANVPKGSFQIGSTNVAVLDSLLFTCRQIRSSATSSNAHEIFSNILSAAKITMGGTASTNEIRGDTTFTQNVSIKNKLNLSQFANITTDTTYPLIFPISETNVIRTTTPGVTSITIELPNVTANELGLTFNFFKFQTNLAVTFTTTNPIKIYTLNNLTTGFTSNTSLLSVDKTMTTLMCGGFGTLFYWIEVSNYSTFDRDYNNTIYPRLTEENSFSNRLNFSAASYSFPFASSQSLGYYLKATTSPAFSYTPSGSSKTILTTATIPIGVWRIDFSVQNTITGAGTITQEQNYVSTALNGAIATAVPFTGSINRSHVNEVYALNDVQVITSSFTYNQSTAGVLYLNIVRTFTGGSYSFIGEIAVTRLA
jgi:hypothetical protein